MQTALCFKCEEGDIFNTIGTERAMTTLCWTGKVVYLSCMLSIKNRSKIFSSLKNRLWNVMNHIVNDVKPFSRLQGPTKQSSFKYILLINNENVYHKRIIINTSYKEASLQNGWKYFNVRLSTLEPSFTRHSKLYYIAYISYFTSDMCS